MRHLANVFLPALVAAVATWLLTPLSASLALRVGAVDRPGPRRIQTHPVPRLGGVAVVIAHLATGVVFVVGSEQTGRPLALRATRQLLGAKATFLGAILIRVNVQRHPYYYSH